VHQGAGDPQSIAPGNNKIIDVGVLICIMFGQGAGDAYTPYIRELIKKAGYFVRDKEKFVCVLVSFISSQGQLGVVPQRIKPSDLEQTLFGHEGVEPLYQAGSMCLPIEKESNFPEG